MYNNLCGVFVNFRVGCLIYLDLGRSWGGGTRTQMYPNIHRNKTGLFMFVY